MAFNKKKNGKTMSGFLKIRDFFLKSVLRKTAEFSVSDMGDPLILTCLPNLGKPDPKFTGELYKKILGLLKKKF